MEIRFVMVDGVTFKVYLYEIDLRLLVSGLPDRLLVGTIAGFDGFGIVSAETGLFIILSLGVLAEMFQ